jgi:hypothetical protein
MYTHKKGIKEVEFARAMLAQKAEGGLALYIGVSFTKATQVKAIPDG